MSRSKLRKDRRGAVTILTIDRPEARNAIDAETASPLAFWADADLRDIQALVGRPGGPRPDL